MADKYRRSHKPLTFSHDSLLVALVAAAQHLPLSALGVTAAAAVGGAAGAGAEAGAEGAAGAQAAEEAEVEAQQQGQQQQQQGEPPALGPIPWDRTPVAGVQLACGELTVRIAEERARRAGGEASVGRPLPTAGMDVAAAPGARDAATGVHTNTADCDCAACNADLWLGAVVSAAAPGVAVCPEHAAVLVEHHGCPPNSLVLLQQHRLEELEELVAAAVARVPGAAAAVAAARERRERHAAERVRAQPCGPMYELIEPGKPAAALATPPEALGESESDWEDEEGEEEDEEEFVPQVGGWVGALVASWLWVCGGWVLPSVARSVGW